MKYTVEPHYDNSWKIKHKGETFANIEGIDKICKKIPKDEPIITKNLLE